MRKCYICNKNEGCNTICHELPQNNYLSLVNISVQNELTCDPCTEDIIIDLAGKIKKRRA